jgi:glutathione S-transferase
MILIGQFDSPFTRRVGIALESYGLPYEHRPWSVFGDADKIAPYNPLLRVPTLVLDDDEALIETLAILDAIDAMVAPEKRLIATSGAARRKTLYVSVLAAGISDKVILSYYGAKFHTGADPTFRARIESQIRNTLDKLEKDRVQPARCWWLGDHMTHADIAVTTTLRHFRETIGSDWDFSLWPALAAHAEQCEVLPIFKKISQPFTFTPPKS